MPSLNKTIEDLPVMFDAANAAYYENCEVKLQIALAYHVLDPDNKPFGRSSLPLDKIQRIMKLESYANIDALTHEETLGCVRILANFGSSFFPCWSHFGSRYDIQSIEWVKDRSLIPTVTPTCRWHEYCL